MAKLVAFKRKPTEIQPEVRIRNPALAIYSRHPVKPLGSMSHGAGAGVDHVPAGNV